MYSLFFASANEDICENSGNIMQFIF